MSQKKRNTFKAHFKEAVTKNQKCSVTIREIGITNQVKEKFETNHNNTETIEKFHMKQAQTIGELMTRLDLLEILKVQTSQAYSSQVPSVITPQSKSYEMIQIKTIIQAVMEEQSKTTEGGKMTMATVTKQSASELPMTMTCPMLSTKNTSTPKATHAVTNAALAFPSNRKVKHASGKSKDTKMMQ